MRNVHRTFAGRMASCLCALTCWAGLSQGQTTRPALHAPVVGNWDASRVQWHPLGLRDVKLEGFLGRHVEANNRVSLPAGLLSPIPAAFDAIATRQPPPKACRRLATDSDFYKWLEGACYALAYDPAQPQLAQAVDRYITILRNLQEPSGYLGTRLSPAAPFDRQVNHDLYVAGHFMEAAVAHYHATGRRELLDVAVRLADFYLRAWHDKHPYYQFVGTQEHPEIELGLVRLYRATQDRRFLDFAGDIARMSRVGATLADTQAGGGKTHAVRLCYLLSGMTEWYVQTGMDEGYGRIPALWDQVAGQRMYVTGGIGYNERIPAGAYDLPQYLRNNPNRDIAETCASVAFMMLSWRLYALDGEAKYFDTIENILYNHYLGAISQDHLGVFYYNPLRRTGNLAGRTDHGSDPVHRCRLPDIHSTSCCLPNAWRFFAQLPEYVFSRQGDELRINLYTDARATLALSDESVVHVDVQTCYPQEGQVTVRIGAERPGRFRIGLRIPAWCTSASIRVNAEPAARAARGYHLLEREWRDGDVLRLDLPMKPVVLCSHPAVKENEAQVAFRRGPLVYCLERQDAAGLDPGEAMVVLDATEPAASAVDTIDPALGLHVLKLHARLREVPGSSGLYAARGAARDASHEIMLIPFYARANRQENARWATWLAVEFR